MASGLTPEVAGSAESSGPVPTGDSELQHRRRMTSPSSTVRAIPIEGQENIDHTLYNDETIFSWRDSKRRAMALELIRASAFHHVAHCKPYQLLCREEDFDPSDLQEWADLARVPLVPSSFFKHHLLLSTKPEEVVKMCLSSGTQGSQSRVPRDNTTLERLVGSTSSLTDLLLELEDRVWIYNLGPDSEEAEDLWFAYVMSVMELRYPATHYVHKGEFLAEALAQDLSRLDPGIQPVLIGAPPLFVRFLDHLESRGHRLDLGRSCGLLVTAGGWKRFSGEQIGREALTERLTDALQLGGPDRVRDAFNMVELNTVLLECDRHAKHIPPWIVVHARSPATLTPLAAGEVGLLSYLDPTATSYPAFILSDDFGRVTSQSCGCGRTGEVLEIERRVSKIESRGCALKIDRNVSESA